MGSRDGAWNGLRRLREASPLVQCITNFVSMDLMANVLLAAGASPAMVHAVEEIREFTAIADALCVNVGTLTPDWIGSMKAAAKRACELNKPWVLDPVGAGATTFRTETCLELLALGPAVVRGNASEILALAGASKSPTKGVDSLHASTDALNAAKGLAQRFRCVVAVSGAVDLVTDGERVLGVSNGVALMQRITASGCAVTALIAAFAAVLNEPGLHLEAAAFALGVFGLAAEIGMEKSNGPASLRLHLIDALHGLDEALVTSRIKISTMTQSNTGISSASGEKSEKFEQQHLL